MRVERVTEAMRSEEPMKSQGESTLSVRNWLARAERGPQRPVLILGASVNGLSFVRSLERRGVPTLLIDREPLIGSFTRLGSVEVLPPGADNAALAERIERIGERLTGRAVLFPTSDATNELVATRGELLAKHFDFLVPPAELLARILDKRAQYRAAAAAGVPIPRTDFPESETELDALAGELEYPCILKPYQSHTRSTRKKVIVASSREELRAAYREHGAKGTPWMVQEIIPGGDDALFGYLGFWDGEGRERAWLTKQKLRQFPLGFGDGSYQRSVDCAEVAELARDLLSLLGYRGLVGVEFKRDPRDGSFRLMEINPRTVSGNQLAISAGVDFPWIAYRHLCGEDFETPGFRAGVHYVNEEWDFKAFLALRAQGKLGTLAWLRSLASAEAFALSARGDWRPLRVAIARMARAALDGSRSD
jgi:predicted ATP-grasp superfamily ATP-dependent carboligase